MGESFYEEKLGRLQWDEEFGCWRGDLDLLPGLHVDVSVWPDEEGDLLHALSAARSSLAWLRANEGEARGSVADGILGLYNRSWSEEGPITREEFLARIDLVEAGFGADGGVTLWYSAGEMFGGHLIAADFDPGPRFRGATLTG